MWLFLSLGFFVDFSFSCRVLGLFKGGTSKYVSIHTFVFNCTFSKIALSHFKKKSQNE